MYSLVRIVVPFNETTFVSVTFHTHSSRKLTLNLEKFQQEAKITTVALSVSEGLSLLVSFLPMQCPRLSAVREMAIQTHYKRLQTLRNLFVLVQTITRKYEQYSFQTFFIKQSFARGIECPERQIGEVLYERAI